jgi:hypothetical protein
LRLTLVGRAKKYHRTVQKYACTVQYLDGLRQAYESCTAIVGASETASAIVGASETASAMVGTSESCSAMVGDTETASAIVGASVTASAVVGDSETDAAMVPKVLNMILCVNGSGTAIPQVLHCANDSGNFAKVLIAKVLIAKVFTAKVLVTQLPLPERQCRRRFCPQSTRITCCSKDGKPGSLCRKGR